MITATVRYKHSQIFAKYQRFQFVNIFSISDRLAIFFFLNISGLFPFMTKLTLFLFVLQVRRSQCHSLLVDAGIGKSIFAMTRRS